MSSNQISILNNPNHPKFNETLRKLSKTTDENNAAEVFKAILSNFAVGSKKKPKISVEVGTSILSLIMPVIQHSKNAKIFISKGFLNFLPYGIDDYSDIIFDIFYACLQADINVFDDESEYIEYFENQISYNPKKALIIISMHVTNFKYIAHPWRLSDLLISQFQNFLSTTDLSSFYLSLISYLFDQYPTYKKHRTMQCWSLLSQLLDSDIEDSNIFKQIYSILFSISNNNEEVKKCFHFLPISKVVDHLKTPNLKNEVLSFVAINSTEFKSCDNLIQALLNESSKNEKASLILMKLAEDESNALLLLSQDSWIQESLRPTFLHTLKIIYCCLVHSKVRKIASKSKRLLSLLIKSSKTTNLNVLIMILGIIQKIHLSNSTINEMSKYGLFNNIISATNSNKENPTSDKILYRIFSTVASVGYSHELLKLLELSSEDIILQSDFFEEALKFISEAIRYKECIDNIKSTKIIDYFRQIKYNQNNMKNNKKVRKNIKIIQKIIDVLDKEKLLENQNDDDEYYEEAKEEEEEYIEDSYQDDDEK